DFEEVSAFNLMFSTKVGPAGGITSYLRPETAQLIFTNFKQVLDSSRVKLPFGIAQIGKAFRNEISPRDFLFRTREFEQFEIEFFAKPGDDKCPFLEGVADAKVSILDASGKTHSTTIQEAVKKGIIHSEWIAYWLGSFYRFFTDFGIKPENLRIREHHKEELAHYAKGCYDIEYRFPFGWKEIHGNADRGTFDLSRHSEHSGRELSVFDETTKEKFIPAVVSEPSQGIERAMLAFLFDAYDDDKGRGNIVLRLHPALAPVKIGVFPLVNKLEEKARKVFDSLKTVTVCTFDRSGSIGRRYARADEQGIPFCVTVDFDEGVTIRDRDSTKQVRVPEEELKGIVAGLVSGALTFEELSRKHSK
ncbi:glycine--tRNA ligase, partial [Candidatus Woesearchaeota archaeon]